MRLQGKVAVITGGSRGIGYATSEAFLREGATVILTASKQETADRAVEALREWLPGAQVEGIWPDLGDMSQVEQAMDEIVTKYGRIDVLVNNAGISEMTPFDRYTGDIFDKVMNLNVKGMFNVSRAVSEHMIRQGSGVILNTSSMVSLYGQPSGIAYPTSKSAVNGFTLSLARELAPRGIRVNAVAPGVTETDMVKAVPKDLLKPIIAQIPIGRLGQPEDIANAFVFLASEEASYISGVVLKVDGLARS